jgi:hypothetical protein
MAALFEVNRTHDHQVDSSSKINQVFLGHILDLLNQIGLRTFTYVFIGLLFFHLNLFLALNLVSLLKLCLAEYLLFDLFPFCFRLTIVWVKLKNIELVHSVIFGPQIFII